MLDDFVARTWRPGAAGPSTEGKTFNGDLIVDRSLLGATDGKRVALGQRAAAPCSHGDDVRNRGAGALRASRSFSSFEANEMGEPVDMNPYAARATRVPHGRVKAPCVLV